MLAKDTEISSEIQSLGLDDTKVPLPSTSSQLSKMPSHIKLRDRVPIFKLLEPKTIESYIGQKIAVAGWIRTIRVQGGGAFAFIELSDGTTSASLQIVCSRDALETQYDEMVQNTATGASIFVFGDVIRSPGSGQLVEMQAVHVTVLGSADVQTYPLAKKKHSLEHLRDHLGLRARTRTFGAVARIRNALAIATHDFFQKRQFLYCNTPILTSSDCEGAGEMFQVTTLLQGINNQVSKVPALPDGQIDYSADFFKRPAFLAVSGQLNVESYACALSNVYTFGPTFRAEKSKTTRHLAEFWMIEPEIAFADLSELMDIAEDYIKHALQYVSNHCALDLEFLEKFEIETLKSNELAKKQAMKKESQEAAIVSDAKSTLDNAQKAKPTKQKKPSPSQEHVPLRKRLLNTIEMKFQRLTYTKAIKILEDSGYPFEEKVFWGIDLPTEMERYLAEVVYQKPVILSDYPREIKAFYMRLNDDNKTVAAMDILLPGVGELVGGSQREERLEQLEKRIENCNLNPHDYSVYLSLRRYGSVPHSGFGLGFERLVRYVTAMENIRDTCMFPRAWSMPLED